MTPSEIAHNCLTAIESHDFISVENYLADDLVFSGPVPQPLRKEEFLPMMKALLGGLPDWSFNRNNVSVEGSDVTVHVQITGTHLKDMLPPIPGIPVIPATGTKVKVPPEVLRIKVVNDKITSIHAEGPPDAGVPSILRQIGVQLPPR